MHRETVDIIIPTMDNLEQLSACVSSILSTRTIHPVRVIVVNNGSDRVENVLVNDPDIVKVINPGKNLGWTGGLEEGLKHSDSEYVMFANDDIYIPLSSYRWMSQLARHLHVWPKMAAVGPATNCAMGGQNIWAREASFTLTPTFLIGFCMLVRRSALDEVGGIDTNFPTGDDIDLSIRFLKANYILQVDRTVFVYHHGFQTGNRLYGDHTKPGGWNSAKMTEDTNRMLINKHGFKAWWWTMCKTFWNGWGADRESEIFEQCHAGKRSEDDVVLSSVNGCKPEEILEIGCGGRKTVEGCVGLDKEKAGTPIPFTGRNSVADVVADAQKPLPFNGRKFKVIIARHVLEHCVDVMGALNSWKETLDDDGTMIISVPDERIADTILLNGDHVHAFTPDSLVKIVESAGLEVMKTSDKYGADSFTLEMRKAAV